MRRILCILLFAAASAHAAPPCWPKQAGSSGSDYKTGATPAGRWLAWTCTVKGVPQVYYVVALRGYEIKNPNVAGMSPAKTAAAYWKANIGSQDPRLLPLVDEAKAAFK